jgi:hypothetical protein
MFRLIFSNTSSGRYKRLNYTTTLIPSRSTGKPEATTAVDKFLMMGVWMPGTCLVVFERQAIKLRD